MHALNRALEAADRLSTLAGRSTAMAAILNVRTPATSMTSVPATTLDATVANARRRFRRVLVAWAADVVSLAGRDGSAVRWNTRERTADD